MNQPVMPFIEGVFLAPRSEAVIEVINPSTGQALTSIPAGCEADVSRAVASCRRAFEDGRWSEAPPSFRKKVLYRWADLIAAEAATLDTLDAAEMGKPVQEPRANAAAAAEVVRFYAEAVDKVTGDMYGSDKGSLVLQRRVPRGVVAAIVPWNFPTCLAALKCAPSIEPAGQSGLGVEGGLAGMENFLRRQLISFNHA